MDTITGRAPPSHEPTYNTPMQVVMATMVVCVSHPQHRAKRPLTYDFPRSHYGILRAGRFLSATVVPTVVLHLSGVNSRDRHVKGS